MQDYFFIRDNNRYIKIRFADILYIEACRNYVSVVTAKRSYIAQTSLKQLELKLDPFEFCRVHRSFIVSLEHMDSFDFGHVYLKERSVPIGDLYRQPFKERLTIITSDEAEAAFPANPGIALQN